MLDPPEVDETAIERARVIHASTFALSREPCRSAVSEAFRLARKHDKIISLDPNYSPVIWPDRREALEVLDEMLSYAHLSKPSLDDARRIFGSDREPEEYVAGVMGSGPGAVTGIALELLLRYSHAGD